ncbi:hypothetical protein FLX56_02095 [Synechococcus moorigangaii CMS01]|nr:hypothetical protein [Synechococcus moorigangaii CMS01]
MTGEEIDEIEVIRKCDALLRELETDAQGRVIQWLNNKFRSSHVSIGNCDTPVKPEASETVEGHSSAQPEEFGELYYKIRPETDTMRALVAAYWCTVHEGMGSFTAYDVNKKLKDLGFGVGNITDAIGKHISQKPALIIQLKKSGGSRQARKTYKLTDAGKRHVRAIIDGAPDE